MNAELINSHDASIYFGVTKQALHIAVKKGRLNTTIKNGKFYFTKDDLDKYKKEKYCKKFSKFRGNPLLESDEFTVLDISKKIGKPLQHIYYIIRKKYLQHRRKGAAYIISQADLLIYLSKI